MAITSWWKVLRQSISEFGDDQITQLSAALSYYAIFSIGPLLLIIVGIAGFALGEDSVRQQLETQIQHLMGPDATQTIASMMVRHGQATSVLTTVIGTIALLSGASGVVGQLQTTLNAIWKVEPKPGRGIRGFLRDRFFSWAMVLGIGFLLLVSMVLSTVLTASSGALGRKLGLPGWTLHGFDILASVAMIACLFAFIFKYIPDVKIPWRNVWSGAFGTSLLFGLGKYVLALYLGRTSTTSAYGAAGSVVIVLLWVYYASVILFFGAEFTQVYTKISGTHVKPTENAVPIDADRSPVQPAKRETPKHDRPVEPRVPIEPPTRRRVLATAASAAVLGLLVYFDRKRSSPQ